MTPIVAFSKVPTWLRVAIVIFAVAARDFMSGLEPAQLMYLKNVLGIESLVMPVGPIELPIAEEGAVHDSPQASTGTSPGIGPQARIRGDVISARLLCFAATAGDEFVLQGEADSLAEKMIAAMKVRPNEVAWVEWTRALSVPCPGDAIDAALSASVPVIIFGDETARSLLGAPAMPGQWVDWSGVRLMATHDLRELLAKPELKKSTWAHLQAVMRIL